MNKRTKMVPSQCSRAGGFRSLLHKDTVLPLDSSLSQAWLWARPWGDGAEALSWLCEWSFCPHTWAFIALVHSDQATLDTGELDLSVFSLISAGIRSALAERPSAFPWRSALLRNLCSEVLFLCLHHTLLWIKFRGDVTPLKYSMERWWTRMKIPPFKKCR